MEEKNQEIYIPVNGEYVQISKEDFFNRFPTERRYFEYLMQQGGWETNKITGNEITEAEFLKLAQFIYDEPEMDSIPILDIGAKIYSLNTKIKYGIETSQIACKKVKEYNNEIPCTPLPENVFWAKLKGIKPLQFLDPAFNAAVSVEDAINFSLSEKQNIDTVWERLKPLLKKQEQKNTTITAEDNLQNKVIDFPNKPAENTAEYYLQFMKGINPKNKRKIIDKEADYIRMLEYTNDFLITKSLPKKINAIGKINLTKGEILFTFYRMFTEQFPNEKYPVELFLFLNKVFAQLKDKNLTKDNYTTLYNYKKFAEKPKNYEALIAAK
jgi:hypothetical protein